ncbi:hypothetical protein DYB37_006899 [Aphanomyces astaci]|uniref:DUF2723 domain-containing protein n=1 Tax=Aphanomyces astaci TaxID=112090 RepID=A0A418E1L0_APHAT|nr:hypothetical protein DYB37_006899 [Aphanomyces astaci]
MGTKRNFELRVKDPCQLYLVMQRRRKSKGKEQQLPSAIEEDSPQAKHWKVSVAADPVMWLVGSAVLGVYSQTIYPSIAGGDSGELVAESCHLGVSHPPGYPLFNMLNYLVVNMPGAQTKAWKANLFSAGTNCMWTPLIWTYAISAEVFALNNLFAAWLLFLLLSYAQSGSVYYANLGAFVCGLAMCNQHTIVLFEIPIVLYVLWTQRRSLGMKTLSTYALYFVVGLLPLAVAFMYTFYLIVFHALSNMPLTEGLLYGVHMRFWQQPNIILFVWGGVGLDAVLQRAWRTSGAAAAGLGVVLSVAAMVGQGMTWQHVGNQSHAWFIPNYAKALLDPLPPHALVFVNYDLQWTAMRYLQRCEGFRPDLTVLNLSMMTYKWFATKHALYPSIVFPGDRLVPASTNARDFHMKQLGAATYLLDETIKSGRPNITWLAECARPLEHSLRHEPRQFWSDSLLKNLGLAYAYIVRSPDEFAPTDADPLEPHVGHHVPDQTKYKDRATDRMLQVWREWIALPSARADPGYDAIADIVRKFTPTT